MGPGTTCYELRNAGQPARYSFMADSAQIAKALHTLSPAMMVHDLYCGPELIARAMEPEAAIRHDLFKDPRTAIRELGGFLTATLSVLPCSASNREVIVRRVAEVMSNAATRDWQKRIILAGILAGYCQPFDAEEQCPYCDLRSPQGMDNLLSPVVEEVGMLGFGIKRMAWETMMDRSDQYYALIEYLPPGQQVAKPVPAGVKKAEPGKLTGAFDFDKSGFLA